MNHARAGSIRTPDLRSPVAEVALLDRDGVIVTVNDAWESFCRDNGGDEGRTGVGTSYLDVCAAAGDDSGVQEAVALVREALAGEVMAPASLLIPCDAPGRPRLFDMLVSSRFDDDGRCVGAAVVMVPHPLEVTGPGPGPIPAQRLTFPDLPRLELERTLAQLASQSQHALAAQGRLRALLQANAEVVSALDLPIVLRKFAAAARDLVHARTAVLSVQGPEGTPDQLVHAGTREPPLVRTGGPSPGAGALTVPVRVRGRLFGHLHLTTLAPGGFSSEDESLAASLAGTAAVAIENATLFEDSERRRRWQEAGAAAGRQLFDGDRDRALVAVLQLAKQAADGDFAMLVSTDDLGMPRVTAFLGAITAEEYAATPGLGAKVLDPVLQDGVPVLVEHDQPGPGAGPRFGSTITVPFHDDDRVLAGLTVGRLSSHRPFQPADLDQFVAFTAQAEVVVRLDRARLEQETMNMLREHDRIAADLHDHVITELFATGMGMQGMLTFLGREDRDRLAGYVDSLDGTIRRIRETIFELHPPDSPPPDVKQRLVAVLEDARPTLGHPAHLEFAGPLAVEVPPGMADDLVAVVRESLANTARHARAGDVRVRVALTGRKVTVEVLDDGCGIAGHPPGRGLANLTGRAERYGGSLKVEPRRGGGTRLAWTGRLPG